MKNKRTGEEAAVIYDAVNLNGGRVVGLATKKMMKRTVTRLTNDEKMTPVKVEIEREESVQVDVRVGDVLIDGADEFQVVKGDSGPPKVTAANNSLAPPGFMTLAQIEELPKEMA